MNNEQRERLMGDTKVYRIQKELIYNMITPENLVKHELIGLEILVEKSTNKGQENLSGKVVDETRQTFTIRISSTEKQLIKDQCVFVFALPSGKKVRIDGKILVSRPEDRIKKKFKTW